MLRASVSADGMTVALALLFLAWLLHLRHQPPPPATVQWMMWGGLGLLLSGCKPVYGLLVFCSLLVALRPDPPRMRLRVGLAALLASATVVALSAALLTLADPALVQLAHGADPSAQFASMQPAPAGVPACGAERSRLADVL